MQGRWASLLEAVLNTAIGFVLSILATKLITAAYDIPMTWTHNAILTFWMTVLSVARSYVLRRFFNWRVMQVMNRRGST